MELMTRIDGDDDNLKTRYSYCICYLYLYIYVSNMVFISDDARQINSITSLAVTKRVSKHQSSLVEL